MTEYVCADCGCTLTHDDAMIDAICKACGGTTPVSMAVYEDEHTSEVDALAYVREDAGGALYAIGSEESESAWIGCREPVEVRE